MRLRCGGCGTETWVRTGLSGRISGAYIYSNDCPQKGKWVLPIDTCRSWVGGPGGVKNCGRYGSCGLQLDVAKPDPNLFTTYGLSSAPRQTGFDMAARWRISWWVSTTLRFSLTLSIHHVKHLTRSSDRFTSPVCRWLPATFPHAEELVLVRTG
jgi:hypothetical protein